MSVGSGNSDAFPGRRGERVLATLLLFLLSLLPPLRSQVFSRQGGEGEERMKRLWQLCRFSSRSPSLTCTPRGRPCAP